MSTAAQSTEWSERASSGGCGVWTRGPPTVGRGLARRAGPALTHTGREAAEDLGPPTLADVGRRITHTGVGFMYASFTACSRLDMCNANSTHLNHACMHLKFSTNGSTMVRD